jgi:dolichol-phosphate mannosyltransferase
VNNIDYSIVIPVYFNEGSLRELVASIRDEALGKLSDRRGEIIFVDDGSGDASYAVLQALQHEHSEFVRVVKLSRNFGQVNAIWCGLSLAPKVAVVMAADGQDDPRYALTMLQAHFAGEAEIIIGTRSEREDSLYRRLTSKLFYRLMRVLSFPEMPLGGFDFFLLGDRARRALLACYQHHGFLQGQILQLGFQKTFLPYHRQTRTHGRSRWSFARKLTYLVDGVLGYSYLPIRIMSGTGALCAVFGFIYACIVLFARLVFGNPIKGWAPLMITVLVIGGLQMLMLGVIGEYLWRVFAQVRGVQPYIVENILEGFGTREHDSAEP